jgi:hypothetical protein
MEIIVPLVTQCPVIGILLWFIVTMQRESRQHQKEIADRFQTTLDKMLDKMCDQLDRIELEVKTQSLKAATPERSNQT